MSAEVIQLRRAGRSADVALVAFERHLARCKLADATKKAYRRQGRAYVAWLAGHAAEHGDALVDQVGAEAAVTAWRKSLLERRAKPASVNQGLAAVTLLHELAGIRISVKRVRIPKPGEPDALERVNQGTVERAAARRGVRDDAIIALLLYCGPRVEEVARLALKDIAITARTGSVRFHGKGDEVRDVPIPAVARGKISAWLLVRGDQPGQLFTGQRGGLTIAGITEVVLAVGRDAGLPGLRPHRLRHTYATRLRQGGADPAQVQALMGHASLETAGRYFRAGSAERAAIVEQVFDQ